MDPYQIRSTRRFALRLIGGATLALPAALEPRRTDAVRGWCRSDPVITLDGNFGSIYVSAKAEDYELNNSRGDFRIEHPPGVVGEKIWEDPNGYFGHGIYTKFFPNDELRRTKTAMEILIRCYVPASRNTMRILLEWAPGPVEWKSNGNPKPNPVQAATYGYANRWIVLPGTLPIDR